jgi:hypothetical protein
MSRSRKRSTADKALTVLHGEQQQALADLRANSSWVCRSPEAEDRTRLLPRRSQRAGPQAGRGGWSGVIAQ